MALRHGNNCLEGFGSLSHLERYGTGCAGLGLKSTRVGDMEKLRSLVESVVKV
jgi:hypothetical protein